MQGVERSVRHRDGHSTEVQRLDQVPKGDKILDTKCVFKKKLDGRFKARLVVVGHRQKPGHDYGRSYAPVCRLGSNRMLLAIAYGHSIVILTVYVDDFLLSGESEDLINRKKKKLTDRFE